MNEIDKLKAVTEQLEQGIKDLMTSERYKKFLSFYSTFRISRYSLNNTLLVFMQKPDATYVAGFETWKNYNRTVIKGSKGIKIIAPAPYKKTVEVPALDESGNPLHYPDGSPIMTQEEVTIPTFRVVHVFDVSQTIGEPLPLIVNRLQDEYKDFDTVFSTLKKISPCPISFDDIAGTANGYYNLNTNQIVIRKGLSETQTLKTAIHEMAHAMLHGDNRIDKKTAEVQAESIAYVVSDYLGIDTSDYSFGYIASWSKDQDLDALKKSLDTIHTTASTLIREIDEHLSELQKQKDTAIEQPTVESLSPMAHAEAIINDIEMERTHFIPAERNLIVNYALHTGNIEMVRALALEMAEEKHGLNKGFVNPLIESRVKAEITVATEDNSYSVYQLKPGKDTAHLRFESYDSITAAGVAVNKDNYNLVYAAPLAENESLDSIYQTLNVNRPVDFVGHSLSVSDVIVIKQGARTAAHYVDSFGFKKLDKFESIPSLSEKIKAAQEKYQERLKQDKSIEFAAAR